MAIKKETETPNLKLYNTSLELKKMLIRVAKSEGRTLTSWSIRQLKEAALRYPESARNYTEDDGC